MMDQDRATINILVQGRRRPPSGATVRPPFVADRALLFLADSGVSGTKGSGLGTKS